MVAITYEFGERDEWRMLVLVTSLPSFFILFFMYMTDIPESPRWLLFKKRRQETIDVLERVARLNGTTDALTALNQESTLMDIPPHPPVNLLKSLFKPSLFARVTLPLWAIFFWLNYASYGLTMWLKAYFSKIGMNSVVRDLYGWMAVGKMLGCLFTTFFIESFPRRKMLSWLFVLAAAANFAAVTAHGGEDIVKGYYIDVTGDTIVLLLFAIEGFVEEAAWGVIYCYSVEVYPSSIRSTGSGVAMGFGRLGGIIASLIGRKVMEEDPRLPFYFVSIAFVIAAISVGIAGVETQGKKLAEL